MLCNTVAGAWVKLWLPGNIRGISLSRGAYSEVDGRCGSYYEKVEYQTDHFLLVWRNDWQPLPKLCTKLFELWCSSSPLIFDKCLIFECDRNLELRLRWHATRTFARWHKVESLAMALLHCPLHYVEISQWVQASNFSSSLSYDSCGPCIQLVIHLEASSTSAFCLMLCYRGSVVSGQGVHIIFECGPIILYRYVWSKLWGDCPCRKCIIIP